MAIKKTATKTAVKTSSKAAPAKKAAVKKTATKAVKTAVKAAAPKKAPKAKTAELTGEQLVVENLATLSALVKTLSETLDILVQKTENMAYHVIATEEILADVVTNTGIDLATVNKRIRLKIAQGTEKKGDPTKAIDVAASIASPTPKTRK